MIKQAMKRGLAKLGAELRRVAVPDNEPFRVGRDAFLDQQALFDAGEPDFVFDIGAHHGHITAKYRELLPDAHLFAFEPFPPSFEKLQSRFADDPMVATVKLAAAGQDGEAMFFSNRAEYTNSLLASDKGATPWVPEQTTESLAQITVETCALDSFCAKHNIQRINILKTDVQGAEMQVLQGARQLLSERRVDALYLEVLFAPLYAGQTDFCELLGFLGTLRYHLVGIYHIHRGSNGLAGWADGLFVREDFPMPDCFREKHTPA